MRYGEARRVVSFNLDKEAERELYEFSKTLSFSAVVKRYLRMELERRKLAEKPSSIEVRLE